MAHNAAPSFMCREAHYLSPFKVNTPRLIRSNNEFRKQKDFTYLGSTLTWISLFRHETEVQPKRRKIIILPLPLYRDEKVKMEEFLQKEEKPHPCYLAETAFGAYFK